MSSFMNEDKLNQLIKISNTCDNNLLNDLIDSFGTESLRLISEIKVAASEKNILKINTSVRSLKLSADYIGAEKLYKICCELEKDASEGFIPRNIETVINELEYYYYQSSDFLDKKKVA